MDSLKIEGYNKADFFEILKEEISNHAIISPVSNMILEEEFFTIEFQFLGQSRVSYKVREEDNTIFATKHYEKIAFTHMIFKEQFEKEIFGRIIELGGVAG